MPGNKNQGHGWAKFTFLLSIVNFFLSWLPFVGIMIGIHLAYLVIVLGFLILLYGHGKGSMGKLEAVVAIFIAFFTIFLKSLPFIRYL